MIVPQMILFDNGSTLTCEPDIDPLRAMRAVMPHSYILVPGYGAQGGTAEDLKPFFNDDGLGAIVNSSRGIICAYKNEKYKAFGEAAFEYAARQAVIDMIDDIRGALCG